MEDPAENGESQHGAATDAVRIGPYRIVKELGRGGMGTVYLCADTAVGDRLVALKVVHDPRGGGVELIERFRREIRNLGVLRHPNIVQVLYAGEHDGHPYFVMEYVRGRELNKWLEEVAALPEPERIAAIVRLMAKVARGVAHAHGNGTIHRDLKPQNILVRDDGEPLVLDFGIAKHREDTTLTASSSAPGTPSHMAPEQFESAMIVKEELVDVWALGTILYQALTRERPFRGHSLASVSYQIVHGKPMALRKLNAHVPPALEDLVLKCLEKEPRKRPQSALVLAEALDRSVQDVVHSARQRRARTGILIVAGMLVIAALVLRPWNWWKREPDFRNLKPVVESVGDARVGALDREIVVPAYEAKLRVRLDRTAEGATLQIAMLGEGGVELGERALLAPGPDGLHEALLNVPATQQHPGMRAALDVFANGERLAASLPVLVFSPEPESRPPPERSDPIETRPAEAPVVVPESRTESSASSRTAPAEPHLPETWGRVTRVGTQTKFDGPVLLHEGETAVFVESALDTSMKWQLRLLDGKGATVAECLLEPLFAASGRTLAGRLVLGPMRKGRTLAAELVITDALSVVRTQPVKAPRFQEGVEGEPKVKVRLRTTKGDLVLELERALSPAGVETFLEHVRKGDYDGCVFHEVRKDQLVKAGRFDDKLEPRSGLAGALPPDWTRTRTRYPKLTVAMTGEGEFEILVENSPSLNELIVKPIEIGKVLLGEDVLAKIEAEPVTVSGELKSAPVTPVVILKASVEGEIGETR